MWLSGLVNLIGVSSSIYMHTYTFRSAYMLIGQFCGMPPSPQPHTRRIDDDAAAVDVASGHKIQSTFTFAKNTHIDDGACVSVGGFDIISYVGHFTIYRMLVCGKFLLANFSLCPIHHRYFTQSSLLNYDTHYKYTRTVRYTDGYRNLFNNKLNLWASVWVRRVWDRSLSTHNNKSMYIFMWVCA